MKEAGKYRGNQTAISILLALSITFWALVVWSVYNMDQPLVRLMMPMQSVWNIQQAFYVWVMWAVMMAAMMLPSAIPMALAHHKIACKKGLKRDNEFFVAGYLLVWGMFSIAATALQWGLQGFGQLSHMLVLSDGRTAAAVLILAGISQITPLKNMCLSKCRTPVGFLMTEWRPGIAGAFQMGRRHGTYCVGCCWALMALLFVFGVMNLAAITVLAAVVAAEKMLPKGEILARIGGGGLIIWGVGLYISVAVT